MPNLDERLLAGNTLSPGQEGEAARQLKERKRGESGETANKISFTDETML